MFGKKKEKQQTENMVSEVNERTAIEILVTEEDKTGSNIMCMSDFLTLRFIRCQIHWYVPKTIWK